jgi:hypothetical protein
MSAPSDLPDSVALQARLPVVLSLNPLAATGPELPVLSIPCSLTSTEPNGPLSWQELLGER